MDQSKSEITVLLLTLHATMGSFYALMRTTLRSFEGVVRVGNEKIFFDVVSNVGYLPFHEDVNQHARVVKMN